MKNREFSEIRRQLGKTQKGMANLLGTSTKAIESFEQGWRNIPVHIERQMLFLLASKNSQKLKTRRCWTIKRCPTETKGNCPAWEFKLGHLCWFINGTICHGEVQESWKQKMKMCRRCEVFQSMLSTLYT